jgi:hypothetical protein
MVHTRYLHGIVSVQHRPAIFEQAFVSAHQGARFEQKLITIPSRGNHAGAVENHDFRWVSTNNQIAFDGEIAVRIDLPGGDPEPRISVFDGIDAQARGGQKAEVALAANQLPETSEIGAGGQ